MATSIEILPLVLHVDTYFNIWLCLKMGYDKSLKMTMLIGNREIKF